MSSIERVVQIEKMLIERQTDNISGDQKEELAKEMIIMTALAKSTDETNIKALKGIDNNRSGLYRCIKSGSKGNVTNLTQLVGALGQQHVAAGRPSTKCLAGGTKSSVFFPKTLKKGVNKYSLQNQGYIEENFTHGLNPKAFFFHCQSGREGIISASLGTADTGYCQRKLVKGLEHISINQDGNIKSPCGNTYQYFYGGQGLNPRICPIILPGMFQIPLDAVRFTYKYYNGNIPHEEGGEEEEEDIILRGLVERIVEMVYGRRMTTVPAAILMELMETTKRRLFNHLKNDCRDPKNDQLSGLPPLGSHPKFVKDLESAFIVAFYNKTAPPFENVGILAAQSASAAQTQSKLDSFHVSGSKRLMDETSNHRNFQRFINATKNTPKKICSFVAHLTDGVERDFVISSLVSTRMIDVVTSTSTRISKGNSSCSLGGVSFFATFSLTLSIEKMYERRLLPNEIAAKLAKNFTGDATYIISYPFLLKGERVGKEDDKTASNPLVITITHEITEEEYDVKRRLKKLGVFAGSAAIIPQSTTQEPNNSFTFKVGRKSIAFKKFLRWVSQKKDYISCLLLERKTGIWNDIFSKYERVNVENNGGKIKGGLPKAVEKSILANLVEESTLRFVRNDAALADGAIRKYAQGVLGVVLNAKISGIRGVTRVLLNERSSSPSSYDVYVEGFDCLCDISKAVGPILPFDKNFRCNCIWDVYYTFGIFKTRDFMNRLLLDILGDGVGPEHASLIVAKMTFRGEPEAFSRYSMRKNDVQTLARASFEEMVSTFLSSAMTGEIDICNDAASLSILGKRRNRGISLFTTPSKLMRDSSSSSSSSSNSSSRKREQRLNSVTD